MQAPTAVELLVGNIQSIGLLYDVAGILILGLSVMSRWSDVILSQSTTYWDFNAPLAEALSASKLDTLFGSLLLALGFSLQFAAQLGWYASRTAGLFLLGALVPVLALYCFWLRREIVKRLTVRIRTKLEQKQELAAKKSPNTAG